MGVASWECGRYGWEELFYCRCVGLPLGLQWALPLLCVKGLLVRAMNADAGRVGGVVDIVVGVDKDKGWDGFWVDVERSVHDCAFEVSHFDGFTRWPLSHCNMGSRCDSLYTSSFEGEMHAISECARCVRGGSHRSGFQMTFQIYVDDRMLFLVCVLVVYLCSPLGATAVSMSLGNCRESAIFAGLGSPSPR
jgi:hypothetical protein